MFIVICSAGQGAGRIDGRPGIAMKPITHSLSRQNMQAVAAYMQRMPAKQAPLPRARALPNRKRNNGDPGVAVFRGLRQLRD